MTLHIINRRVASVVCKAKYKLANIWKQNDPISYYISKNMQLRQNLIPHWGVLLHHHFKRGPTPGLQHFSQVAFHLICFSTNKQKHVFSQNELHKTLQWCLLTTSYVSTIKDKNAWGIGFFLCIYLKKNCICIIKKKSICFILKINKTSSNLALDCPFLTLRSLKHFLCTIMLHLSQACAFSLDKDKERCQLWSQQVTELSSSNVIKIFFLTETT